tara:strand:- start:4405 stop:5784 length:1380 start_codon:yes stop_codon:yes gene_type:complete
MQLKEVNQQNSLVSIIIRVKNEEEWISKVLEGVFKQSYKNFEVIIVDNNSTDSTLNRVKKFPVKIVGIDKFIPGKAINIGIRESKGEIICILSGHCIPFDENWLQNLIEPLKDNKIAGCYGRQVPTNESSNIDKRDLLLVFGLDDKLQIKDSFFHNANSAFKREIWEKVPFCENATNIEDRLWGQEVINKGYKIYYKSDAKVYHWHGIHHSLNEKRAKNIVKILENISELKTDSNKKSYQENKIFAFIPIKGLNLISKGFSLLEKTKNDLISTNKINKIYVSSDCEKTLEYASKIGLGIILRPNSYSEERTKFEDVAEYTLKFLENQGEYCDQVLIAEEIYPFRNIKILLSVLEYGSSNQFETISAAIREKRSTWYSSNNEFEFISGNSWSCPNKEVNTSSLITLLTGYITLTKPKLIRDRSIFSRSLKAVMVNDLLGSTVARDKQSIDLLSSIINIKY